MERVKILYSFSNRTVLRILSEAEEVEYVTEVAHFSRQENHDSVAS